MIRPYIKRSVSVTNIGTELKNEKISSLALLVKKLWSNNDKKNAKYPS